MPRVKEKAPIPRAMMMVVTETLRAEMTVGTAIPVMMVAERSQTADPRMQVVEVPLVLERTQDKVDCLEQLVQTEQPELQERLELERIQGKLDFLGG